MDVRMRVPPGLQVHREQLPGGATRVRFTTSGPLTPQHRAFLQRYADELRAANYQAAYRSVNSQPVRQQQPQGMSAVQQDKMEREHAKIAREMGEEQRRRQQDAWEAHRRETKNERAAFREQVSDI